MRATFSQFESGLKISPPSGKTVIDLFDDLYTYFEAREAPLSALRATLPEGVVTSSVGYAATFPDREGKDICHVERKRNIAWKGKTYGFYTTATVAPR